jgi:hypothetical protein
MPSRRQTYLATTRLSVNHILEMLPTYSGVPLVFRPAGKEHERQGKSMCNMQSGIHFVSSNLPMTQESLNNSLCSKLMHQDVHGKVHSTQYGGRGSPSNQTCPLDLHIIAVSSKSSLYLQTPSFPCQEVKLNTPYFYWQSPSCRCRGVTHCHDTRPRKYLPRQVLLTATAVLLARSASSMDRSLEIPKL